MWMLYGSWRIEQAKHPHAPPFGVAMKLAQAQRSSFICANPKPQLYPANAGTVPALCRARQGVWR